MKYLNDVSYKDCIGKVCKSKSSGDFKILKYNDGKNVEIQFLKTGFEMSKIDNKTALNEIMLSQEKREALVSQVKRLALDVTAHKTRGDIITDDIKTVAENLGITNSKLNELIKIYNKDLEGIVDEMASTVDILGVIKDSI